MKRGMVPAARWCMAAILSASTLALAREGGGYTQAGLDGSYFASPDLSGKPVFTRRDVRVDFDWGSKLPVGGSPAEPYRSFKRENFSVRWTGQVLPRFSEPYTFVAAADEGIRVKIRKAGATDWITLIDRWQGTKPAVGTSGEGLVVKSAPFALEAGQKYDFVVEYHEGTGEAICKMRWSAPSVPEEVIDPVTDSGLNLASWSGYVFADRSKEGRWWKVNNIDPSPTSFDAEGWPKHDGEYILSEGHKGIKGTYLIQFNGKAEIEPSMFKGKLMAGGKTFDGKLPLGEGYNAATNTTTARMQIPSDEGNAWIKILKTSRDGSAKSGTGVTNLRIMRPVEVGSSTPHNPDEVVYRPMKSALGAYTCLRWLGIANSPAPGTWNERTPANSMQFARDPGGENWENLIIIANETGRDLYLCAPLAANNDYLQKLALLLKYGSDGKEPYTSPQENPKYPPLNPNLRVYLEVGNEIWNWAFGSTQQCQQLAKKEMENNTEDGKIAAAAGEGNYRTWHAVRTVRASNIFREVFGDQAMGERVRILVEYQYANAQETAWHSFRLIDGYFNNGVDDFVRTPHPVSYYVWGAGGAAYYGVGNGEGAQTEVQVPEGSFEQVAVADGTVKNGVVGNWMCAGGGGIYRNLTSAVAEFTPGKKIHEEKGTAVGFKFKTGEAPLYVYQLGQSYDEGSPGADLQIVNATTKEVVAEARRGEVAAYMTKIFGYYFADKLAPAVKLDPNTEYYLLSFDHGQTGIYDGTTRAKAGAGLQILSGVRIKDAKRDGEWNVRETGEPDTVYGPVTFLYSTKPALNPTLPQPPYGQQAAVIYGDGEVAGVLKIPKDGTYALNLNAFVSPGYVTSFEVYLDSKKINPKDQGDFRIGDAFGVGGWGRNNGFKEEWGSAPFTIKAGLHKIRIVGKGPKDKFSVFDNLTIASADAIMTSGFGSGSALGQPVENEFGANQVKDSAYAMAFGLARVSYESGWSLGGDFYQKPLQNWCKLMDPRAEGINDKAVQMLDEAGTDMAVWGVYTYWPVYDFAKFDSYPIMKSTLAMLGRLPSEENTGPVVPAELKPEMAIEWHWGGKDPKMAKRGMWRSWVFCTPAAGECEITATVTGTGSYDIAVDDKPVSAGTASVAPGKPARVWLTKGGHGIRVRNTEGLVSVDKLLIRPVK